MQREVKSGERNSRVVRPLLQSKNEVMKCLTAILHDCFTIHYASAPFYCKIGFMEGWAALVENIETAGGTKFSMSIVG